MTTLSDFISDDAELALEIAIALAERDNRIIIDRKSAKVLLAAALHDVIMGAIEGD